MRRREFVALLGGATAAWPLDGFAQTPPKRPLVGLLAPGSKMTGARFYYAFPQGMRELGYLEGHNYAFADRYAGSDLTRLPLLADELVRLKPDVIVTVDRAPSNLTGGT